jgi:hypothetical protein
LLAPLTFTSLQPDAFSQSQDELYVLVDHANVHPIWHGRTVTDLAIKVLETVAAEVTDEMRRVRLRLYGGWFEEDRSSRTAQRITPEIADGFPLPVSTVVGIPNPVVLNAELAVAILSRPTEALTHTYVRRARVANVYCKDPPYEGCSSPDACPVQDFHAFLSQQKCQQSACSIVPDDVVQRAEQKLADTMLAVDLCTLAALRTSKVVVLSDDYDAWPAILASLSWGTEIIQLRSRGQSRNSDATRRIAGRRFREYNLQVPYADR